MFLPRTTKDNSQQFIQEKQDKSFIHIIFSIWINISPLCSHNMIILTYCYLDGLLIILNECITNTVSQIFYNFGRNNHLQPYTQHFRVFRIQTIRKTESRNTCVTWFFFIGVSSDVISAIVLLFLRTFPVCVFRCLFMLQFVEQFLAFIWHIDSGLLSLMRPPVNLRVAELSK